MSPFLLVRRVWLVELRGFEPRAFSLRRRSRPHRSPVYALHKLHADRHGAPVPSAGGTGGARRLMQSSRPCPATAPGRRARCGLQATCSSLAGELGHRRGSNTEPLCSLRSPHFARAVSYRHVHDLRRHPTSRCPFVPLVQPVPTRPHRFRQICYRLLTHRPGRLKLRRGLSLAWLRRHDA